MSWSVEGRVYHSYVEYEKALARQRENRLRKMVERLEIPAADTSRIENELAAAQVRQQAVQRLAGQIRREAAERQAMIGSQREEIARTFGEIEQSEQRLLRDLEGVQSRLEQRIGVLEEQRRAESATVTHSLENELAADRQDAERVRQRRQHLIEVAGKTLSNWNDTRLRSLGLDGVPVERLLQRAQEAGDVEGLELARRAHDQARALEAEAAWRESRLKGLREVYRAELEELRAALRFSPEVRRELVGEGAAALDLPLQNELDRLAERIESVQAYEDHEDRFERIGQGLDTVALRVSDLAAQVRDFDRLEDTRLNLVRNQLEANLAKSLGESVRIEEVEPGELGLHPVEVKLQTAGGEKIDCSVSIDGTMRIHHYEHVDQASCARSARKLAESLPELMALQGEPRLDIAAEVTESRSTQKTAEMPAQKRVVE